MSHSPIPVGAADRIIRNPHSLPRIPSSLAGIIAQNRHQDRLRKYAEDSHQLRRSRLENQRAQRIVQSSPDLNSSYASRATPSPPLSPQLNAVVPSSPLLAQQRPMPVRLHRSHSVHSRSPPPGMAGNGHHFHGPRGRSLSFSSSSSQTIRELFSDPSATRRSSLYLPELTELEGEPALHRLPAPNEVLCGPWLPGHSYPFSSKIFSNNPEERVKQRCYFSKRPSPAWRSRNFELNKQGEVWTCHPSWHRFMRDEYKVNGQEEIWRDERNRFLQAFRRERQFQKQAYGRMSPSF
jgi:hypothetical protein